MGCYNGFDTFFVERGLHNGEEGVFATRCGTEERLADGWYVLYEGEDDPSSGPFETEKKAIISTWTAHLMLFGIEFKEMKGNDFDGFAGAEPGSFIGYQDECVLIYDPKTKMLTEILPDGTERNWQRTSR